MVAHSAVMGDVGAGVEDAIRADGGDAAAERGAGVHRDVFADLVAVADHQARALAQIGRVLRRPAETGERVDDALRTHLGDPVDDYVGEQARTRPKLHLGPNHAIGADLDAVAEYGAVSDERRWMDAHNGVSTTMTPKSASAATLPSTVALPLNLNTLPRRRTTSTGMRSWSPGRT